MVMRWWDGEVCDNTAFNFLYLKGPLIYHVMQVEGGEGGLPIYDIFLPRGRGGVHL